MNARWQRALGLLHVLCLLAWLAWAVPRSSWLAAAGVVLLALLARLLLAPQFVLMAWACRRVGAPVPGVAMLGRAWWAEGRWSARVFGWWQPWREQAVPDWLPDGAPVVSGQGAGHALPRAVVLVHGFACNRAFWMPWFATLRAHGHGFVAPTLEPAFGSIDAYVDTIDAAVRRARQATGRAPLIVAHSMGGLALRAWLRAVHARGADADVYAVVTIGTPHHGTWAARWAWVANGRQMEPGSAWLRALAQQEPAARHTRFICWYSDCDNAVYPPAAATLEGADNRLLAGLAHIELAHQGQALQACLELLKE